MRGLRVGSSLFMAFALGCGSSARSSSPRAGNAPNEGVASPASLTAHDAETLRLEAERVAKRLERLRHLRLVGMDDGPVPAFTLVARDGTEFDSERLVGYRPFVVAFFATWCDACERKLRSLDSALGKAGPMLVIPISVDGPETRDRVDDYLRAVGLTEPAVLASDYPLFALSYNAFDTVPLLVIVGKNGGLVDYQLGYVREHERRLAASLRLAQIIGPLARPESSAGSPNVGP
jgi:hypothetical protein